MFFMRALIAVVIRAMPVLFIYIEMVVRIMGIRKALLETVI